MDLGKAIIFGANGQDGHYLSELLTQKRIAVVGVSRSKGNWVQGDVTNLDFVAHLVKTHQPGFVFHLAANSTSNHSALFENNKTICEGTWNILESVRQHSPSTKVFITGSALQFKNKGLAIDEAADWYASSPYAVSRIQSVYASRYYRSLGLEVYVGYLFNHDSPLRSERHITQKIAQTAKRIAANSKEILEIGNLDTKKEFTFAGDVTRAIWDLVNNSSGVFECVIGSGKAYSIRDWLSICFSRLNLDLETNVRAVEGFKADYEILVSNPTLLRSLGWQPDISIETLASMMLE